MRASPARSIRMLREGERSGTRFRHGRLAFRDRAARLPPEPFTNKLKQLQYSVSTRGFGNTHELSIVVFAAQGRPSQASKQRLRAGAVDAHAGGQAFARAAAVECGILRPARDAGWIADRRSLAGRGHRLRQPRCARHLLPSSRSPAGARWSMPFTPRAGRSFCSSGMSAASRIPSFQPGGVLPVTHHLRCRFGRSENRDGRRQGRCPTTPRALETGELANTWSTSYGAAARNAQVAGFGGVEIRSAPTAICSSDSCSRAPNRRTDRYGGSESRTAARLPAGGGGGHGAACWGRELRRRAGCRLSASPTAAAKRSPMPALHPSDRGTRASRLEPRLSCT